MSNDKELIEYYKTQIKDIDKMIYQTDDLFKNHDNTDELGLELENRLLALWDIKNKLQDKLDLLTNKDGESND